MTPRMRTSHYRKKPSEPSATTGRPIEAVLLTRCRYALPGRGAEPFLFAELEPNGTMPSRSLGSARGQCDAVATLSGLAFVLLGKARTRRLIAAPSARASPSTRWLG